MMIRKIVTLTICFNSDIYDYEYDGYTTPRADYSANVKSSIVHS